MLDNHNRLEQKLDSKLSPIDNQMSSLNLKLQRQDENLTKLGENMVDRTRFHSLENTLRNVASQADHQFMDIRTDVADMRTEMSHLKTENSRLNHHLIQAEVLLKVFSIKAKRHNFSFDGLMESGKKKENLRAIIVQKVNTQAKVKISQADIVSAYHVGKFDKNAKNPRTVNITVKNDQTRNTILKCRTKLPVTEEEKAIYVNEDLPPFYRRRKLMLHDLVRVAKEKDISAKIEKGGLRVDGKYYGLNHLTQLLEAIKPQSICTKQMVNGGFAFASEWSPPV